MKRVIRLVNKADTQEKGFKVYLDDNEKIPLQCEEQDDRRLKITYNPKDKNEYQPNRRFVENLTELLSIRTSDNKVYDLSEENRMYTVAVPLEHLPLSITVNDVEICQLGVDGDNALKEIRVNDYAKLTVSETRMLARHLTPEQREHIANREPFSTDLGKGHLPITDLHTHLSAQLTGKDWREMIESRAKEGTPICYPKDLLEHIAKEIGIEVNFDKYEVHDIPRIPFKPAMYQGFAVPSEIEEFRPQTDPKTGKVKCDENGKAKKELIPVAGISLSEIQEQDKAFFDAFIGQMEVPIDETRGPYEMDTKLYRYRNPLEKDKSLQDEKMYRVARRYAMQGVQYAELSTTEVLTPEWLEKAIEGIEKAETRLQEEYERKEIPNPPPKLRLMAAIHRAQSPDVVARYLENAKIAAGNPYVVGVDFVGYEGNKTEDLNWALYEMARWIRHQRNECEKKSLENGFGDFVIRVHAGETSKNADNVADAIRLAETFGVKVRIGHAVHGVISPEVVQAAKDNGIIIEFIPDSNIALENIDFPNEIPMKKWADSGVPFVINSDGAGLYQTTPLQAAKMGLLAGLQPKQLKSMQTFEKDYIQERLGAFKKQETYFKQTYSDLETFIRRYREETEQTKEDHLPPRYQNKIPILVAGASGSNWKRIREETEEQALEVDIAMNMMVKMLDPQKVHFMTGRVKDRGIEKKLDEAVVREDHDTQSRHAAFDMIATIPGEKAQHSIANAVNWVNKAEGNVEHIPEHVTNFIDRQSRDEKGDVVESKKGYCLFVGGGHFTRDFIAKAEKRTLNFGMVKDVPGSSRNMARRMDSKHVITSENGLAKAIIRHLIDHIKADRLRPEIQEKINEHGLEQVLDNIYQNVAAKIEKKYFEEEYPEAIAMARATGMGDNPWARRVEENGNSSVKARS